jgi:hypothetical protein
MHNRRDKEGITRVRKSRKSIIPAHKSTEDREKPTRLTHGAVRHVLRISIDVSDSEEEEGEGSEEEHGEEGDGGFEGA